MHMKAAANVVIALTALACLAALAISVYPGALNELLFRVILLSLVAVPVVAIAGITALIVLARKGKLQGVRIPWARTGVVLALLLCTSGLLKLYVPRRIGFAVSRAAFERLVPLAPPSEHQGTPL